MEAMTDMTQTNDTLREILASQSSTLIRAEVRAQEARELLIRAAVDAVAKHGKSVDFVSEATGLTTDEIRAALDAPVALDDLDALAGVA